MRAPEPQAGMVPVRWGIGGRVVGHAEQPLLHTAPGDVRWVTVEVTVTDPDAIRLLRAPGLPGLSVEAYPDAATFDVFIDRLLAAVRRDDAAPAFTADDPALAFDEHDLDAVLDHVDDTLALHGHKRVLLSCDADREMWPCSAVRNARDAAARGRSL